MRIRWVLALTMAFTMALFTLFMTQAIPVKDLPSTNRGIEFVFEDRPRYDRPQDSYEVDPKAILKRSIYFEPYLIFQAGRGEKPSDHFLMALQVHTGELTSIHRGYHRRFWLQDDQLFFQHVDRFFVCPWGEWTELEQIADPSSGVSATDRHITLRTDVPELLRAIDCETIHVVLEGSFTYPQTRELLFITGRNEGYRMAVYRADRSGFSLQARHEYLHDYKPLNAPRPVVHFREALALDIDSDGCLEVLINGVYATEDYPGDPMIYADFSRPVSGQTIQTLAPPLDENDQPYPYPRLIAKNTRSFELHLGNIDPARPSKVAIFELVCVSSGELQMSRMPDSIHYPIPPQDIPRHQDFISTRRNLASSDASPALSIPRLPELRLPPLYTVAESMEVEERIYHRHRNAFLQDWISRIEGGWNPFEEVRNSTHASFYDPEALLSSWQACHDLISIRWEDRWIYVVSSVFLLQGRMEWILLLYDNQFRLIELWCPYYYDYQSASPRLFPDPQSDFDPELIHTLLPLPGERSFMILYPSFQGRSKFQAVGVSPMGFSVRQQFFVHGWSYQDHHSGMKLHLHTYHPIALPWSDPAKFKPVAHSLYIDPFSGEHMSRFFNLNYRPQLDQLYYDLRFLCWADPLTESFNPRQPAVVDIVEMIEEVVYYRAHTLMDELWDMGTQHTSY